MKKINMIILKWWLIFNVFISLYEIYIIKTREIVKDKYCVKNFWTVPFKFKDINRLQAYWIEYACKVDNRYFNKNSYVYYFEAINVITTVAAIILYFYNLDYISFPIFFQMINCCMYFYTIPSQKYDYIDIVYLSISALWILIPLYILIN
jgi:hypothetical protein